MLKNLFLLIILICNLATQAQIVKGRIFAFETDNPIPYASIYFDGTLKGTVADVNGNFSLKAPESNKVPIIVSAVGYYSGTTTNYSPDTVIKVYLKSKAYNLDTVIISLDGMPREIKERMFISDFIGTTKNALACEITNINDVKLVYRKKTKTLEAFCDKPLIINNRNLGYKITYYLDRFKSTVNNVDYAGYYYFEENTFSNSSLKRIYKRREDAYLGSRMHFIRSLWNNNLKKDGFKLLWHTSPTNHKNITADSILIVTNSEKKLQLNNRLTIIYNPSRASNQIQFSTLLKKSQPTYIDKRGFYDSEGTKWIGAMTQQRVGDLLPFEYQSSASQK